MTISPQNFFVRRTCTERISGKSGFLEDFRDLPAYVLLGNPGVGKTTAFKEEERKSSGRYITARDFITLGLDSQDKVLFIDGLDEMRTNNSDGRIPLDQIRTKLNELGKPSFRLSCREIDWLGESDESALESISSNKAITILHRNPLTNDDIIQILRKENNVPDPDEFFRNAQKNNLDEMLRNPHTLNLLVKAVQGSNWTNSRSEVFKMACSQLARERNSEHQAAKQNNLLPSSEELFDAAGYLCAICLLSRNIGVARTEDAIEEGQYFYLRDLNKVDLPFSEVLKTNLFTSDSVNQVVPMHRSIAEYLGARYLAT